MNVKKWRMGKLNTNSKLKFKATILTEIGALHFEFELQFGV
jgi:hypothetical protein